MIKFHPQEYIAIKCMCTCQVSEIPNPKPTINFVNVTIEIIYTKHSLHVLVFIKASYRHAWMCINSTHRTVPTTA